MGWRCDDARREDARWNAWTATRWGLDSNCFVCEEKNPARIVGDDRTELDCRAEVIDGDGETCAEASATFVALGPAQALKAAGARMPDSAQEFIGS